MPGDYFITICTKNRNKIFWSSDYSEKISAAKEYTEFLSPIGQIAQSVIKRTDDVYNGKIRVDKFVIMPDHIHLIISIYDTDNKKRIDIPAVINQLKRCITIESKTKDIWQKDYSDHIIRNERDYNEIWDYIDANPRKYTGNIFLK